MDTTNAKEYNLFSARLGSARARCVSRAYSFVATFGLRNLTRRLLLCRRTRWLLRESRWVWGFGVGIADRVRRSCGMGPGIGAGAGALVASLIGRHRGLGVVGGRVPVPP